MRPAVLFALLVLGTAPAAGEVGLREDLAAIRGIVAATRADLVRRREAAGFRRLDLVCAGAIDRQREQPNFENPPDLVLALVREDGRWTPGSIHIPGYTPGRHRLAIEELTVGDGVVGGTLRVTVDPSDTNGRYGGTINYKRRPDYPDPVTFAVEVTGTIDADGAVTGRYLRRADHGFPAVEDVLTGTLGLPATGLPELPPLPDGAPPAAAEVRALELHRHLLLVEWMAVNRAGAAAALERVPAPLLPRGERPAAACAATVRRVRGLAELLPDRLAARRAPLVGNPPLDDPDFGPFVAVEPLPVDAAGANRLDPDPARLVAGQLQRWRSVGRWRVLGPVPRTIDEYHSPPSLPDHVVIPDAAYVVELPQGGQRPARQATATWKPVAPLAEPIFVSNGGSGGWTRDMGHGRWIPHQLFTADAGGGKRGALRRCGYWAAATVTSTRACELYLATGAKTHRVPQRLYLNDRLVWIADRVPDPRCVQPAIVTVRLRAGENRLLLHAESSAYEGDLQPFTVSLCTAGAPRPAAAVAAHRAGVEERIDELVARRAHIEGLITDWNAHHPAADPPLAWDLERGINVRWDVPLAPANSNVVVVGDRVFTTGDPHVLYCLDAASGDVLWRRDCNVFELHHPDKVEKADRLLAAAQAAEAVLERYAGLQRKARDGDAGAQAAQRALRPAREEARRAQRTWQRFAADHVGWGRFPWWHSPAWASPVTDGEQVWVKFGTGVVACFDLEGERRWMIDTGAPRTGTRPSPILVDGVLVVMVPRPEGETDYHDRHPDARNFELLGLAADSGETLWRQPVRAMGNEGSPIPVPISDGETAQVVICTPCGTVVRPRDGEVLVGYVGQLGLSYQTPHTDRDQIFWAMFSGSVRSGRLLLDRAGRVGFKPLWRSVSMGMSSWQGEGRYQLQHGGICYRMGCRRGSTSNMPWHEGVMLDAVTGRELRRILPIFHSDGGSYVPHAQAGRFLFFGKNDQQAVVTTGPDARVVCRNDIPRGITLRSAPVFDRDAMYLRHDRGLTCVAVTGAEGRRYQARRLALHLVDHVGRPPAEALRAIPGIPPLAARPAASVRDPWSVRRCTAPARWLQAGPFPRVEDDGLAARIAGPTGTAPRVGDPLEVGGERREFVPLPAEHIRAEQDYRWALGIGGHIQRAVINVSTAVGGRSDSTTLFYAPLHNSRPRVVRQGMGKLRYIRLYLNGVELEHERLYRLPRGVHHLLLRVDLSGSLPAGVEISANPLIYAVADPVEELHAWVERVEGVRGEMERLIGVLGGDHPLSRQLAFILKRAHREDPE